MGPGSDESLPLGTPLNEAQTYGLNNTVSASQRNVPERQQSNTRPQSERNDSTMTQSTTGDGSRRPRRRVRSNTGSTREASLRNVSTSSTTSYQQQPPPQAQAPPPPYQRQPPSTLQRGWAAQGYYDNNPWYNQPKHKEKPIFSLGGPLPHTVRRHHLPRRASRTEDGQGSRASGSNAQSRGQSREDSGGVSETGKKTRREGKKKKKASKPPDEELGEIREEREEYSPQSSTSVSSASSFRSANASVEFESGEELDDDEAERRRAPGPGQQPGKKKHAGADDNDDDQAQSRSRRPRNWLRPFSSAATVNKSRVTRDGRDEGGDQQQQQNTLDEEEGARQQSEDSKREYHQRQQDHHQSQQQQSGQDEEESAPQETAHSPEREQREREAQDHRMRQTVGGVGHSGKRNDAGLPVFDYQPGEHLKRGSRSMLSPRAMYGKGGEDGDGSLLRKKSSTARSGADGPASPRDDGEAKSPPANPEHYSTPEKQEEEAPNPNFAIDSEPLGAQDPPPVAAGLADPDEFRNGWARLRARYPEPLAEFLCTTIAVLLGLTATLSVNLSSVSLPPRGAQEQPQPQTSYGTYETACWSWGFAWMFGIYLGGGVSGAHMNPAISLSLSLFRGFPWRSCAVYLAAQFLAGLAAGGIAYGLYRDSILRVDPQLSTTALTFFSTPREWVSAGSAVGNQVAGGAVMMIAVFALGDDQNNPPGAGMHALVLGLLVTTLKFALGYNVGSALNPASDFGPRVVLWAAGYSGAETWSDGWWFYGPWAGTVAGGILGCVAYDGFVFVGSESPVNFKWTRGGWRWRVGNSLFGRFQGEVVDSDYDDDGGGGESDRGREESD